MDIPIACGTVIKGDTETVYRYLVNCETLPTVQQIVDDTGLREDKVRRSLMLIRQQFVMYQRRKHFSFDD